MSIQGQVLGASTIAGVTLAAAVLPDTGSVSLTLATAVGISLLVAAGLLIRRKLQRPV